MSQSSKRIEIIDYATKRNPLKEAPFFTKLNTPKGSDFSTKSVASTPAPIVLTEASQSPNANSTKYQGSPNGT